MTTRIRHATPIVDIPDWELVCVCCYHGNTIINLSTRLHEELYLAVWAKSDGYGEPGFVPPQGYDWSGVRDSSEKAKTEMAQAARSFLGGIGKNVLEWHELKY